MLLFSIKRQNSLNILKIKNFPGSLNSNNTIGAVVCGIFFSLFIIYTAKTFLLGTCFVFDDYSYHAASCAHWMKDGYFSLRPFNYHAYYPFNSELISLWLMLPFGNDCLIFLSGFFWMILLLTTSACFVSFVQKDKTKMFAVMSVIILSNVIYENAKSFSAVDLSCSVMTLCAVYLIGGKKYRNISACAFSGLFLGFAIGSKISFLPVVLIFCTAILITDSNPFRQRFRNLAVFTAAMLITGSFWYARNFILTGNPVYPAEFLFFKGAFSSEYLSRTKLIYWLTKLSPRDYLWLIKNYLDWPFSLATVSVFGYLSYPFINKNKKTRLYNILFFTGLIFLIFYPFTPFSGTVHKAESVLRVENRFLILPFTCGIILSGLWNAKNPVTLLILLAIMFADKKILLGKNLTLSISFIIITSIVFYLFRNKLKKFFITIFRFKFLIFGLFLFLITLLIPHNKTATHETIKNYGHKNQPIGKGWNQLNVLPYKSIITFFGEHAYQYYPLFGRNFNLIPLAVSENGLPYLPLHERNHLSANKKTLITNLMNQKINYVFISRKIDANWPAQYFLLSKSDEVEEIYNDGCSAILKIRYK